MTLLADNDGYNFFAGLGDLVRAGLSRELDSLRVEYADDSAILVHTDAPEKKLCSLTYVRNCFRVLDEVQRGELSGALGELANRLRRSKVLPSSARGEPFRLMFSVDGQLIGAQPAGWPQPGGMQSWPPASGQPQQPPNDAPGWPPPPDQAGR